MPDPKEDYLPHCNSYGVSQADFHAAFCSRCLNPSCQRSQAGTSLFEQRASTWKDRLFDHPATLPQDDPRFAIISAQKFQEVPPTSRFIPEVGTRPVSPQQASAWLDPRELGEPAVTEAPKPAPSPAPRRVVRPEPEEPEQKIAAEEISEPADEPQKSAEPPRTPQVAPQAPRQGPLQTPFQQGAMIGGASLPNPSPPKDAWAAAPSPPAETATVIKPGGKIRFGKGSPV